MSLIRPTTRTIAGIGAGAAALLLFAGAASAHLEPDPASITAGQAATVAFNVEHGCDGSPTIELQIKLADGITDAQPVQKDGWTSSVTDGVVTFTGGSLPATTQQTFSITFTAPTANGALVFPSIQKCTVGQINWIEPTVEGQPEPEDPAPVVQVTGGSDAATTTAPPSTATATTATAVAAPDTTSAATAAPEATEPATTTATTASTEPATTVPETATTEGGGGGSNAGLVTAIIIAAIVVLAGGGYALYRARKGGDGGTPGAPPTAGTP